MAQTWVFEQSGSTQVWTIVDTYKMNGILDISFAYLPLKRVLSVTNHHTRLLKSRKRNKLPKLLTSPILFSTKDLQVAVVLGLEQIYTSTILHMHISYR